MLFRARGPFCFISNERDRTNRMTNIKTLDAMVKEIKWHY